LIDHFETAKEKIVITPEAANATYFKTDKAGAKLLPYDYFIYVGNAYPHKNIDQLIKAVKIVAAQNHKVKLVIVTGRDWFYRRLRLLITKLKAQPVVKLKDFTSDEDLRRLYQNSVAFVTASLYEGFGIPILDAFSCRLPVITSNVSSMPEVAGEGALFVDPRNPAQIARAVKKIIDDNLLRDKLIQSGFENIKKFSWERVAELTFKSYMDVIKTRS